MHVGPVPEDLRTRARAVAEVDAAYLASVREGTTLGEVFAAVDAYARTGFPGEERRHHQGGLAGYEPREALAAAGSTVRIGGRKAFAFNPSVPGAKCEDTVLLDGVVEVLTAIDGWPTIEVEAGGRRWVRPGILEL